jgi:hypothetical protein
LQVDQAVHPSEPKPSMVWLDKIIALKSWFPYFSGFKGWYVRVGWP